MSAAAPSPARADEQQQIEAVQRQLQAVQAQLRQLAEQNAALLQHQQQLDAQLAEQRRLLEQQQRLIQQQAGPVQSARPEQAAGAEPSALPGQSALPEANAVAAGSTGGALPGGTPVAAALRLWGYGELYYTRPTRDANRAQADLARAVFGIGYRFDERTEFNSEYEVEHAIASASDRGEFEVEQFYVDRQLADPLAVRAGLFLMPFGFINEHHEPTNFYGVQRNFIETLIIPSTWREGGLSFHGDTSAGFAWNLGVTTGFDLSKWEFAPEFPLFTTALDLENNGSAPLQATHQELSLANGRHLSQYVALSYSGLPGLDVGGAAFTGKAVPAPGTGGDSRVTLWEGHARWSPGRAELSALYAHGAIGNLASANRLNPGSPNPIPSAFYGYYVQGAYNLWQHGDYRLAPFIRWENFNLGSEYSGTLPQIPAGLVPLSASPGDLGLWPQSRDRVWTAGANLYVTPHVVLKADYQWYQLNSAFNRLDLGLGLNF
ncbi:MAG: hypothetical protein JOZ93_17865 [Sinobacteraceae bacterium]|nr:hypothetical protein [Nevskiaceae bacterium]